MVLPYDTGRRDGAVEAIFPRLHLFIEDAALDGLTDLAFLDQLPVRLRHYLTLRGEGLPLSAIATSLGVREKTAERYRLEAWQRWQQYRRAGRFPGAWPRRQVAR